MVATLFIFVAHVRKSGPLDLFDFAQGFADGFLVDLFIAQDRKVKAHHGWGPRAQCSRWHEQRVATVALPGGDLFHKRNNGSSWLWSARACKAAY